MGAAGDEEFASAGAGFGGLSEVREDGPEGADEGASEVGGEVDDFFVESIEEDDCAFFADEAEEVGGGGVAAGEFVVAGDDGGEEFVDGGDVVLLCADVVAEVDVDGEWRLRIDFAVGEEVDGEFFECGGFADAVFAEQGEEGGVGFVDDPVFEGGEGVLFGA